MIVSHKKTLDLVTHDSDPTAVSLNCFWVVARNIMLRSLNYLLVIKHGLLKKSIVLHDDFPTFLIFFLVDFPASHFWWHRRAFIKTCLQLLASKNDSANDWHIIARCFVLWTTAICRCMQRVTHGLTDLFKIEIFGIISTVCWTINLGDYGILNCTIMGIF